MIGRSNRPKPDGYICKKHQEPDCPCGNQEVREFTRKMSKLAEPYAVLMENREARLNAHHLTKSLASVVDAYNNWLYTVNRGDLPREVAEESKAQAFLRFHTAMVKAEVTVTDYAPKVGIRR